LLHNRNGILISILEREADQLKGYMGRVKPWDFLGWPQIVHYGDGTCMWYTQSSVSPVIILIHKLASAGWLSCGITP